MDNNKRTTWDFGGPVGNILMIIGLPTVVYYLYFAVRFNHGMLLPGPEIDYKPFDSFLESIAPTWRATGIYAAWIALQAILQGVLPGKRVEGMPLADGTRLSYKMNGPASFIITLILLGALMYALILPVDIFFDNFGSLITVATIFTFLFGAFLYFYNRGTAPAAERSGNPLRDFFLGAALNPRIPQVRGFDLKFFCEARPGLILWIAINLSFMAMQYRMTGTITLPMLLVNAFQFLYIADYFRHEQAILSTMDIMDEHFGFMLAFGDLVWVPFTYSLQAFFLLEHTHTLPAWGAALIILLNAAGFYLFRAVNIQKHRFRSDPERPIWGKKPEYIRTRQGGKLLVSGFWGLSRHFNYMGDLMMALAWSLPCLFSSPLPYFYPVYFAALLVHRERRDYRKCALKYGEDWQAYCKRVRWRIVPRLY